MDLPRKWTYLASGIERYMSFAQQGTTGRLEKNGDLVTEPSSASSTAYNPLPDPTSWALSLPEGIVIQRGKVGLLRVSVQAKDSFVRVDHARRLGQRAETATHLAISGLNRRPVVHSNGKRLEDLATELDDVGIVYLIPLGDE